ncbi:MAG: outer membrane beta-barrel protein [Bacteroidaceae bacterium]|nr:outer membrane beta-barrel protein [Bacteroidaceae bacterium]
MKTKLLLFLAFFSAVIGLSAQQTVLQGRVVGGKEKSPLDWASVRLLRLPDSTLVTGASTDTLGRFTLATQAQGRHLLQISYVGLPSVGRELTLPADRDTLDLGQFVLEGEDIALRAAVVRAVAARVEQKEDTTIFNAAAFRTPEGSTLEALVKQLPGAEIAEDGSIKINGKTVTEFLVNGKDFFKGDTKVAMKNLPTNIVSRLKTYDKKSDYAEQTGIDDGNETFVLDISTKRELNQSIVSNIDLGGGWDYDALKLYSLKAFVSRFTDKSRVSFFASHNNVGDAGFGGPRFFGGGGGGLTTSTMVGGDFSWDNGRKRYTSKYFEVGGNLLYYRSDNNTESTTASETFLTSGATSSSFANAHSWNTTLTQQIRSNFRLQWSPDSMTSISIRPEFTWSKSNTTNLSRTATFDQDPFAKYGVSDTDQVLEQAFRNPAVNNQITTTDDFLVNLNHRQGLGESTSSSVGGRAEVTRKLPGKAGRNVNLEARGNYSTSNSFSYSKADIYTRGTTAGVLEANGTHQFSDNNSKSWNYLLGASYVEPLSKRFFAEFRYQFEHRFSDSNRSLYNLYSTDGYNTLADFMRNHSQYGSIGQLYIPGQSALTSWLDPAQALSTLNASDVQAAVRDDQNSQYATYNYDIHDLQLRLRYNTDKINSSFGLSFSPQRTHLEYNRPLVGTIDTMRTVFHISPQVRFRYRISKTNSLMIFYRGSASEPSMTNLLNVVDSSDPLNISMGNPGLKPTWNDMLRMFYNGYDATTQRGFSANANFSQTRNSISNVMIYDQATGRQFTRPENINGNWNAGAGVTYNTPLDKSKLLTLATSTNARYARSVGYVSTNAAAVTSFQTPTVDQLNALFAAANAEKNVNRTLTLGENLDLTYRQTYWDVALNGAVNYQHSRSALQPNNNLDTWTFSYGATANLNLNNGFSLSTDIRMQSRRGFAASSMNTNELIWNAQISKTFLRSKALTLSLKFYDILQQESNISRNLTAMMRSDSWNNQLTSYFMLHLSYKLNIFAGSKGAKNPENDTDRPTPPPTMNRNMPSPPPGGPGGFGPRGGF